MRQHTALISSVNMPYYCRHIQIICTHHDFGFRVSDLVLELGDRIVGVVCGHNHALAQARMHHGRKLEAVGRQHANHVPLLQPGVLG